MLRLRIIPDNTSVDFVRARFFAFAVTGALALLTIGTLLLHGLNYGIDFTGGLMIEAAAAQPIDIGEVRRDLGRKGFENVQLQQFGGPNQMMIRLSTDATEAAGQQDLAGKVKTALGPGYEFRRVEMVGPSVSAELLRDGVTASILAVLAIALYVWFRFEWQFGVAALVATAHDVFVTVGLLAVTDLEFNMASIAALLTLAGYSINDTIVVFDRIRENLRKHKKLSLAGLVNLSVNETLTRTVATSGTTLLAVAPLLLFGGPALLNFSAAIFFGIVVGTYSSIYVAAALLLYLPPLRSRQLLDEPAAAAPALSGPPG